MSELTVSEIFGPTFQGEGPSAGRHCAFVRLGRCNLDCAWCDTPYTWDWRGKNGTVFDPRTELRRMDSLDICLELDALGVKRVVITGGEPMIQRTALRTLVHQLAQTRSWTVEIETNGTIAPCVDLQNDVAHWNVSPKLANSGIAESRRINPAVLRAFADLPGSVFKFVVCDESDLDEVAELDRALQLTDGYGGSSIWIMPEGRTQSELLARAASLSARVLSEGWNMTLRQQVLLWGDTRGT